MTHYTKNSESQRKVFFEVRKYLITWCALDMSDSPLTWLNVSVMSGPNIYPHPLGEFQYPSLASGSDHNKSAIGPSWSTSVTRSIARICKCN